MRRCAFLSIEDLGGFVSYDHLVRAPLAELGWSLEDVPWRASPDWDSYDIVVIRTTWDYQASPDVFVSVLADIARATQLENPLRTVRWNLRKSYLGLLEQRGVRIVPTLWGDNTDAGALRAAFARLATDQIVIKPQVGANSDDVIWLRRDDPDIDEVLDYAAALFARRRFMIQPFVPAVIAEGEFSLIFFAGDYSHAVLKTPKRDDFRVQEEHGSTITAVTAEPDLIRQATVAIAAMTAAGIDRVPLYARADMVRMDDGGFALMELELIEPSLYLLYDGDAPERFARAIDARAREPR